MTAKDPRKRYIAFRVRMLEERAYPITKKDVIAVLRGAATRFYLVDYDPESGIGTLACTHDRKDEAIQLLRNMQFIGRPPVAVSVCTLMTSGTLRALRASIKR